MPKRRRPSASMRRSTSRSSSDRGASAGAVPGATSPAFTPSSPAMIRGPSRNRPAGASAFSGEGRLPDASLTVRRSRDLFAASRAPGGAPGELSKVMATKGDRVVRVGVVGATGVTGQEFIAALSDHPRLQVTHLAASARSAGKRYRDALRQPSGAIAWYGDRPLDPRV